MLSAKEVEVVDVEAEQGDEDKDGMEDEEPPDLDVLIREAEEKNYPEHVKKTLRKANL